VGLRCRDGGVVEFLARHRSMASRLQNDQNLPPTSKRTAIFSPEVPSDQIVASVLLVRSHQCYPSSSTESAFVDALSVKRFLVMALSMALSGLLWQSRHKERSRCDVMTDNGSSSSNEPLNRVRQSAEFDDV
jgi:hypothetical protein